MNDKNVILILRVGLAFSFFYAAMAGFFDPNSWVGYLPLFLTKVIEGKILLLIFGGFEIILGLAIIFMEDIFYPAVIAVLMLGGIVVFNLSQFNILFRDISIILMAIALAIHFNNKKKKAKINN